MSRPTNWKIRVSRPQIIDLIQLQLLYRSRIYRNAMFERYRYVSAFKELDNLINLTHPGSTSRNNCWNPRGDNFFDQRPIIHTATCHFDHVKIHFLNN